ncbi:hypothetical protein BN6_59360 [Saccharothrix espanaensis DSM 44229]|uniref:Uncharacterized protein n=1 Tax=Saccharothrix espanaensis (strain ATCC 51144 / DSM 44229 / JCM 9112 / NBRC 15066 / NRRL 15764) TaxID=1179773 RepID=K0K9A4_SACES|nr:hypothetical protein BN6_59360 [Saccharothrix espanaensis DSM 44229]
MTKDELLFNTWLTSVNTRLGRYVVRLMEESVHSPPAGRTRYGVELAEIELELADDLSRLAQAIALKAAGKPYPVDGR